MDVAKRLAAEMKAVFGRDGDLQAVEESAAFGDFMRSELFANKVGRFDSAFYLPEETAHLYSQKLVISLFDENGWGAVLTRHDGELDAVLIHSLPLPSLIGPAIASGPARINTYSYPRELDLDPSVGAGTSATFEGSVELSAGQFWSPNRRSPAYRLASYAPGSIFLRLSGPPFGPYNHTFDPASLDYRFSGFSNHSVTCCDIFSQLAVEMARSGLMSHLSPSQFEDVGRFFETVAAEVQTAPSSKWNLVEALYSVSPDRSRELVEELARQPGPLQAVARQTLEY